MQINRILIPGSLVFTLAFPSVAAAQAMSGTYTIDAAGSGTRNYPTFAAATADLGTKGVNGPVVFNVALGTTKESWTIPAINGTSSTNTVTFRGVRPSPSLYLVQLEGGATHIIDIQPGANNIIIDSFDFVRATGLAIQAAITASNIPAITDIEVTRCRFQSGISGDNSRRGHIYVEGRNIANSWRIHDNEFDMGAYNYGMYMSQVRFHEVVRNRFKLTGTNYGMYWINNNNSRNVICNNLFTGSTSTSTGSCAINVAASNINNDVCFNTISLNCAGDLIRTFGTSSNYNRIYGNILQNTGTGGGINVTIASLNYLQSNGNLFDIRSGPIGRVAGTAYATLAAWQGAILPNGPNDVNSQVGDPKFVSATDFHVQQASPAFNSAVTYAGRHVPADDFEFYMRGSKQDMGAFETAAWISYGAGCPGTGGKTPVMSVGGNVAPGESASIDLADGRPGSSAALTAGVTQASISLGGACTLLNQPLILLFFATDASGNVSVPGNLPASTVLTGTSVFTQFGVVDPASAAGIATSQGVDIRL